MPHCATPATSVPVEPQTDAVAPVDSGSSTDTVKFTVVFPVAVTFVIGGLATDTVGPITRIRPTSVTFPAPSPVGT